MHFSIAAALLLSTLGGCRSSPPPNIVVYVVDTLRADALHCYGNPAVQTPAFDRLAAAGTRFERAYANASWTRASMGSLLTGEYPSTHGAVGRMDSLRQDMPSLPTLLRQRGYRTAAIIANPNVGRAFGFAKGFDDFTELYQPQEGVRPILPQELIAAGDRVVEAAISWLNENRHKPFFLLVFSIDPHAPYTPPAPYDKRYDPDYSGSIDGSLKSMLGLGVFGMIPPEREIRHLRGLYDGEVAFNDMQFGRLLDTLERLELADESVVIATSDHGEEFYEHGARDHGHSLYEELIRVPLIVRWPHRVEIQTYSQPVQLADLFPTLLRLGSTDAPPVAGRDISPALLGGRPMDSEAYAELDLETHHFRALIRKTDKVIVAAPQSPPQYFDLLADPHELQPHQAASQGDLLKRLDDLTRSAQQKRPSEVRASVKLPDAARQAMEALGYVSATPDR
ncbi:MAG: sulfatase [Deltaproteobacteria bacterium]|nr:sulfatase [Deltaproteobacteria bacterium]